MVKTLGALLLCCTACTLIVDRELSSRADGGPGSSGCAENPFVDGSPGGGGPFFHSGVDRVRFHGPGFPAVNVSDVRPFRSTVTFFFGGALELAGGADEQVGIRTEENFRPTVALQTGGHVGPGSVGCAEILAGNYDSAHNLTQWQLISGGCDDDSIFHDGGVTAGAPLATVAGVGWAPDADAGGLFASVIGSAAQDCAETYPLSCFPPGVSGPPAGSVDGGPGVLDVDGMITPSGAAVWAVTGASSVALYSADFTRSTLALGATPGRPTTTLLASDVAMTASLANGRFVATSYDTSGAPITNWNVDLGDPGAHDLHIAHFTGDGSLVRAAFIGGDGAARYAAFDTAQAGAAPAVHLVCGGAGASFAAPMTPLTTLVQVADGLYLRPQ